MKFIPNVKIMAALVAGLVSNASLVQAADHVDCQLVSVNQEAKIVALDAATGDLFGYRVAIDGDTMVTSSLRDDDGGEQSGSAHVYVRNGNEWSLQAKLVASDAEAGDRFGWGVSINGNTVVIGAPGVDDAGSRSGSAYVFVRNGTTWTQQDARGEIHLPQGSRAELFPSLSPRSYKK